MGWIHQHPEEDDLMVLCVGTSLVFYASVIVTEHLENLFARDFSLKLVKVFQ